MDMGFVFFSEIAQGGEDRVGPGLPQPTQSGVLDRIGELLHDFYIAGFTFALAKFFQQLQ